MTEIYSNTTGHTYNATISEANRLSLVSSLYGPGAIGWWLCLIASVMVSWTLNATARKRDTFTNDLAAVITLPAVAAGHLIYQVNAYQGDRSSLLTTDDPAVLPRVAAIEAALNVCEPFSAIALPLFVIAGLRFQLLRITTIGSVGLACFGTEVWLFLMSSDARISRTSLSRPYILNVHDAFVSILSMLALLILPTLCVVTLMALARVGEPRSPSAHIPENGRRVDVEVF